MSFPFLAGAVFVTAAAIADTSSPVRGFVFSGLTWSPMRSIGATPPESRTSLAPLSIASFRSRSMAVMIADEAEAVLMVECQDNGGTLGGDQLHGSPRREPRGALAWRLLEGFSSTLLSACASGFRVEGVSRMNRGPDIIVPLR